METKKILPIDKNPKMITCIHHAYQCSIIDSEDLAHFEVNKFEDYSWDDMLLGTDYVTDAKSLVVKADMAANAHDFVIWRDCKEIDQVIICTKYIKPMGIGRYVDIFLFNNDPTSEISLQDKSIGFRWNPYGYFLKKKMFSYDTKEYKYLKVCRNDGMIVGYCSKDGKFWYELAKIEIFDCVTHEPYKIGIHAHFGENYVKIWKNMNFIQLIYNEHNEWKGINLDYYAFPRKNVDNGFGYYTPFLDTIYETTYEILDLFKNFHNYLHWNIQHNYYPELCLDELYVPDREHFQKTHYNHYNLFYGFDDEKRVYYILGYGANNKPLISELPYSAFEYDNFITSEKVTRCKFAANDVTDMKFNLGAVKVAAYEFLNSINSADKLGYLLTQEPLVYGVEIFKVLATEEPDKKIYFDRRIAVCILEHSKMMREKIDYYYMQQHITPNYYSKLVEQSDIIISKATIILNLVIKGLLLNKTFPNVLKHLMEMYSLEKSFFSILLDALD